MNINFDFVFMNRKFRDLFVVAEWVFDDAKILSVFLKLYNTSRMKTISNKNTKVNGFLIAIV